MRLRKIEFQYLGVNNVKSGVPTGDIWTMNIHLYVYLFVITCTLSLILSMFIPAAQLLDAIDFHVDPCEDFFQYACGSWNTKHIIPEDSSSFTTFEKLHDELQVKLKRKSPLLPLPPLPPCLPPSPSSPLSFSLFSCHSSLFFTTASQC